MRCLPAIALLFALLPCPAGAQSSNELFTLQIGAGTTPPLVLVNHGDLWRYRLGTNAPPTGWKTNADATLDATWATGPGGFGYEDGDDATLLLVMSNRCSTLYIRRTFEVTNTFEAGQRVELIMDYDDGFIAWLDGVEIGRSSNAPGAAGTEPAYNALSLPPNHEALGYRSQPLETYNAGLAAVLLQPGPHVLSVLGLNGAINSGDFSLLPNLRVTGGTLSALNGQYLTLANTNTIQLSGSNTVVGATRVVVNGDEASFNPALGLWSKTQSLTAGMNHLFIAALDSSGAILASTNKDIVADLGGVNVGGLLASNTSWTSALGTVRVTNTLTVGAGHNLAIGPGTVVLMTSPNSSIIAQTNGTVDVAGTENAPVLFLPADGSTLWGELGADGTNASLTVRHAETVAGRVRTLFGGTVLVEDSVVRDFPSATREIVAGVSGAQLTLRRTHLARYSEIDSRNTPFTAEDCLVEYPNVDGMDIKSTNASVPLVVRRTTLRFGSGGNTDAIDLGPGPNVTIERCLTHDWPDKGVSVGAGSEGVVVRGCLFYNVGKGVEVADSATAVLYNNTVSASSNGFRLYQKTTGQGGGHATGTNNILWGNSNAVILANGSTLDISYSDLEGGGFAGDGNIDADPLFLNPTLKDFRLASGSPALGTGLGGADMGAIFPVGGIPAQPVNLAALTAGTAPIQLKWLDQCENEDAFLIQRSTNGVAWQTLGTAPVHSTGYTDSTALFDQRYYYRIRATNSSGASPWSNPASATRAEPRLFVGGVLTSNTVWSPALGTIIVLSNLTVPTNITLTMLPGTRVQVTNNTAIRAVAGGTIDIAGTATAPVRVAGVGPTNIWRALLAIGAGSALTIRHADVSMMQTSVFSNAVALIEDSTFHDYVIVDSILTQPILVMHFAAPSVVRRCQFREYYETLWRNGVFLIEYCLFENMVGDALDFDAAQPGTVLRHTTFRHGNRGNVDAVDVGPADLGGSQDVIIERCLMFDFPFDKGVSIGEGSYNTTVRHCLMYQVSRGVQVKDTCTAVIHNNTIVDSAIGLHGYFKTASYPGGGRITNSYNNILWHNTNAFVLEPDSVFVAHHTDLGGTNWPGEGNINADPLFLGAASRDYRLATNSPCRGSGENGADMGPTFPVGGVPDVTSGLSARCYPGDTIVVSWTSNDLASGYVIERATNSGSFAFLRTVGPAETNLIDAGLPIGSVWAYRLVATNFLGASFATAPVSALVTGDTDSDGLPDDYELAYGLNPNNPLDAGLDGDHDGLTSLQEYIAGTNPTNAASVLKLEITAQTPTEFLAGFTAISNRGYSVLGRTNLTSDTWRKLFDVPSAPSNQWIDITNTLADPAGYFRVVTPPQP